LLGFPKDTGILWETDIFWIPKVNSFAQSLKKFQTQKLLAMKKVRHIISSPRGTASYSIQLAEALIDRIVAANPGSTVQTTDLVKLNFPHLEEAQLTAFFTPADQHTEKDREAIRHSDEAIKEIMDADILVIGAPMYNFGIPSALKAWLDHIIRAGVTFRYSEKGIEGLIKGKKVYLILSSGGVYSEGPMKPNDFVEPYLRTVLGFIGLTDLTTFRVEGSAIPGIKETALEKAIERIGLPAVA
jgi:FMN-dependent NADH-azoreductase